MKQYPNSQKKHGNGIARHKKLGTGLRDKYFVHTCHVGYVRAEIYWHL